MAEKKGFTLIELLVVVAIISALSAMLLPNFMAARQRARDSQRKSDLRSIQKAMELFMQNQSAPIYPVASPVPAQAWTSSVGTGTTYMNKFPFDPGSITPTPYYYTVDNNTLNYTWCACLENSADPDGTSGNCSASYVCSSGLKFTVSPQ